MKERVLILDLDGVVVDSPGQKLPSEELIEAVKRVQENFFVSAATGRVWSFARGILEAMELSDPCIISAGTQICDPKNGEILWELTIDEGALSEVIKILRKYSDWKVLYNDGTEDDYFNGGVYPDEFEAKEPVYFLEQVFVPDKVALKAYEELKQIEGVTCVMVVAQKPGTRDLHIVNSRTTKEYAIARLLEILGVEKKDAIGVGDSHNDLHMFKAVGYKVAMGNAIEELKEAADEVIGSVEEDGLVEYLNSLK